MKVAYYTIHIHGSSECEYDKFIQRFENSYYREDLETLLYWIQNIGEKRGAKTKFFRKEDSAEALPPPQAILSQVDIADFDSNLRLYCLRCSDTVVILGGGGVKESKKVKDSPSCLPHFTLMNAVAKEVTSQLKKSKLSLTDKQLQATSILPTIQIEIPIEREYETYING